MINTAASYRIGAEVDYQPGDEVSVHAFGRWYDGVVVRIGRTRVVVRYTSGTGYTREKSCGAEKIRERTRQL